MKMVWEHGLQELLVSSVESSIGGRGRWDFTGARKGRPLSEWMGHFAMFLWTIQALAQCCHCHELDALQTWLSGPIVTNLLANSSRHHQHCTKQFNLQCSHMLLTTNVESPGDIWKQQYSSLEQEHPIIRWLYVHLWVVFRPLLNVLELYEGLFLSRCKLVVWKTPQVQGRKKWTCKIQKRFFILVEICWPANLTEFTTKRMYFICSVRKPRKKLFKSLASVRCFDIFERKGPLTPRTITLKITIKI